jgi:hypothetical protein
MSDAVQIRRCSRTLCANRLLLQTPNLKISNRESHRLEIHATHTKQTTDHHSNREYNACFSNHDQPARRRNLKISNRECNRLETAVTQRKQITRSSSNREEEAHFSIHDQLVRINSRERELRARKPAKRVEKAHNSPPRFCSD